MIKSEKGVSLVELLAALSLLSIIILLANSLHFFAQNQTKNQTTQIQSQENVRLAMNLITKEIRSADSSTVSIVNGVLTITPTDNNEIKYITYQLEKNTLNKNTFDKNTLAKKTEPLISDLKECTLLPTNSTNTNTDYITITISSNSVPPSTLTTTIYLRKSVK